MASMDTHNLYLFAADAVLLMHILVVVFIVFGLVFIYIGNALQWSWIRNPWFRWLHLLTMMVVVLQSWLNILCPLTSLEMALRARAGDVVYSGSFIANWLQRILYYQAPFWVFIMVYTLFGLLVIASWFLIRPRRFSGTEVS